jgi:hypothetical protein
MLSVTKNGTGTGTIFSDQSGINCGTSCIAIYSGGTVVNLTATASVGSAFADGAVAAAPALIPVTPR